MNRASGELNGRVFNVSEAVAGSGVVTKWGSTYGMVLASLTNRSNLCAAVSSIGTVRGETRVDIIIGDSKGTEVVPGVIPVSDPQSSPSTPPAVWANVFAVRLDSTCAAEIGERATGGSVTLAETSSGRIKGTFRAYFRNGSLEGEFDTEKCAALMAEYANASPGTGSGGTVCQ